MKYNKAEYRAAVDFIARNNPYPQGTLKEREEWAEGALRSLLATVAVHEPDNSSYCARTAGLAVLQTPYSDCLEILVSPSFGPYGYDEDV